VEAIASISGVINQINDISSTIAIAVEVQDATTNEMSRNVSGAAQSSVGITSKISGMAEAAQGTTRGASDTQKASQQLGETAAELRRLVEQFKINTDGAGSGSNKVRSMALMRAIRLIVPMHDHARLGGQERHASKLGKSQDPTGTSAELLKVQSPRERRSRLTAWVSWFEANSGRRLGFIGTGTEQPCS
jgi:uncharacterized phage infection (PIP) family protein YhgE